MKKIQLIYYDSHNNSSTGTYDSSNKNMNEIYNEIKSNLDKGNCLGLDNPIVYIKIEVNVINKDGEYFSFQILNKGL